MNAHERIPGLPSDGDGEPVFSAPWQAQAFAMTLALHELGLFTWSEWAQMLGSEIARGNHGDGNEGYYLAWLTALEKMTDKKGLTPERELHETQGRLGRCGEQHTARDSP